ncbi:MAG: hypothetical protein A2X56_10340 [Nitrospirae bacterium GWC2_57_13]|nr:MAG: hypothetical protein A2X56_10340 [Nitrospirae bacterium GWC2_57_13]OGW46183.1 MAG: hypothetical protein A2X57_04700 [Nitrospirae bacterium GWD2_57_8]HAS55217.1 50S ribosomal protein L11 methyltransferase [Nitrospiraceae bacterium]
MEYYELTITVPDVVRDSLIQKLSEAGTLGLNERENDLVAYFPASFDLPTLLLELDLAKALLDKTGAGQGLTYRYSRLPDTDWNEAWKKAFTALDVGARFTILPPWEEPHSSRTNIIIDPGMAFGTGHHETTRSCLLLMEKLAAGQPKDRFLDVGTGTGILAIAAAHLGFREINAVDTDPLAVDASRRNAELNALGNITFRNGTIDDVEGTFPLITANLFSGILIHIAHDIALHVAPGGSVILSGMIEGQEQDVITAFNKAGLGVMDSLHDGKWVTLAVSR